MTYYFYIQKCLHTVHIHNPSGNFILVIRQSTDRFYFIMTIKLKELYTFFFVHNSRFLFIILFCPHSRFFYVVDISPLLFYIHIHSLSQCFFFFFTKNYIRFTFYDFFYICITAFSAVNCI